MAAWAGVSEAYARSFGTLCAGTADVVLDALGPGPVVDVGCGTGTLLARATQRGDEVLGLDADELMVRLAGRVAPGRVARGALPDLPLADRSAGAVAANFVVNHLDDPRAGVTGLARVLRPGGRLAMTIWPAGGAGWATLVGGAFDAAGVVPLPSTRLPEAMDFPRTVDGLSGVATGAGLRVVDAREVHWTWDVRPEDLWAGIAGGVATVGQTFLAQDDAVRERAADGFRRRAEAAATDGLLHLPSRALLVVATR